MMRWMLKAKILLMEMNLIKETIIKIVAIQLMKRKKIYQSFKKFFEQERLRISMKHTEPMKMQYSQCNRNSHN
jgi:hypothetical protein